MDELQEPAVDATSYYLIRALSPNEGTWGADFNGIERIVPCGQ